MKKVMTNKKVIAIMVMGLVAIFLATSGVIASPPMGAGDPAVASKINYQGQLTDSGGNPLNGTYDMEFRFYDAAVGGSPVGSTITENDIAVTNGLFNVKLAVDQSDFNGQGLWLEAKVEGETLSPRQEILPVPYALSLKPGAEIEGEAPGNAVLSVKNSGYGYGIYGEASSLGEGIGVYGTASGRGGIGVYGLGTRRGGHFESKREFGEAVYAVASGNSSTSVYGQSSGTSGTCYGGFFRTNSPDGSSAGVRGIATAGGDYVENYGGSFWAFGGKGCGVFGSAQNEGDLTNYGGYFIALGSRGIGVYGKGGQNGYAADFQGNVIIRARDTGDPVVELGEGLDYAEGFDVSNKKDVAPGSVLTIDPNNPGKLTLSDKPYDSKVAGIIAGAKEFSSGVRLGAGQFDYDVALAGRVYCNVDATEAAVEPGDLLTTSATPGYAMKVTDYGRAQGAILGKAMERLEKGQRGQILVLVTLQ